MKKKVLAIVMASAMLCAAGCSSDTKDETTTVASQAQNVESKYAFEANGKKISIGESADSVLEKLGEATSKFTAVSCAFEGEDHMYTYGTSYQITTSNVDGNEVLTCISLLDDMVSTKEGVKIGSTDDEVAAAMGVSKEDSGKYEFKDGKTSLVIVTKEDAVISITYSYVN